MTPASGVEAVDRALAVLAAFREGEVTVSLAELARRTGYYKSTLLRLAASLERAGYLVRMADRGWRIGPTVSRLAAIYQAGFRLGDVVEPVLQDLVRETQETAAFHVRDGDVRVSLYRVESPQRIRDHVRQGEHLPLERGAGGRVLLAFSGAPGPEFDRIRERMSFVSMGDRIPDLAGVAAPVFDAQHQLVGALTVSAPAARFDRKAAARIERIVLAHAAKLTASLGGSAAWYEHLRVA